MAKPVDLTCSQPDLKIRCERCGTVFYCGEAPHDSEGCLCPECGSNRVTLYEAEEKETRGEESVGRVNGVL